MATDNTNYDPLRNPQVDYDRSDLSARGILWFSSDSSSSESSSNWCYGECSISWRAARSCFRSGA